MNPTFAQIIEAVEAAASPALQESWDNTGWQIKPENTDHTPANGAMLCLDFTDQVLDQALELGCDLIISHHPALFSPVKSLDGSSRTLRAVQRALRHGVNLYSTHTALDSAPRIGVSWRLAYDLGLNHVRPLIPAACDDEAGLGAVGDLPQPMPVHDFVELVKKTYRQPHVVTSAPLRPGQKLVSRVALCGGAGNEFYDDAVRAGADAYVTSDIKYHHFVDHGGDLLLVQTGHHESEICTKSILADVISKKFPNFALHTARETNPVDYR